MDETSFVKFVMPAKREFVGLARLAVGGAAANLPFDDETIEDIKLALSEVCTNMVLNIPAEELPPDLSLGIALGSQEITIDIGSPSPLVNIESLVAEMWDKPENPNYGLSIVTALMDQVELVSPEGNPSVLRLRKFIELPI